MISRKNRFHGHNSVSKVRGKSIHSENFSIRCASNRKDDFRLAVVVSKKVDKRAVVRNRIRRRVFEVIRTSNLLDNKPVDVVVYVKNSTVAEMPVGNLTSELISLLNKSLKQK